MSDTLKAVGETAAAKAGAVPSGKPAKPRPELIHLRFGTERTQYAIDAAGSHFEQAVGPTLIDCYIYELNAAQLRYQFLLRELKSQED